jgi:hypothetical protein
MKTMTPDSIEYPTWLTALSQAANLQRIERSAFDSFGMGALRSAKVQDRFVTLKRRAVSAEQAAIDGVSWTLWVEENAKPVPVASFREALVPTAESVARVLTLLCDWLVERWTVEETQTAASQHPGRQALKLPDNGMAAPDAMNRVAKAEQVV